MAKRKNKQKANREKPKKKAPKTREKTRIPLQKIGMKGLVGISIGLTILYYLIFQVSAKLDNSCFIGGDTWEYHSMGVNLAKGHGINKFGAFEPYEDYKFTFGSQNNINSFKEKKRDNFRRTPGYSFFLGMIYTIGGVNVALAKHVQLFLIAFIAGFIPLFGRLIKGKQGYITGLIAAPFIMLSSFRMSELMMTEALTAFSLFAMIWAIGIFLKNKTNRNAVIMGVVIGISLLVKGTLIFIPMILVGILGIDAIRTKSIQPIKSIVATVIGMAIFIIPWSTYATIKQDKFTLLSNQGSELLLDSNNEFTKDGSWHPEYRKDKANPQNYFHNQAERKDKSSLQKVISFYSKNPGNILPSMANKLHLGLNPFPYLWIILLALFLEFTRNKLPNKEMVGKTTTPLLLIMVAISTIFLLNYSEHQFIPNGNIFGNQLLPKFLTITMVIVFSLTSLVAFFRRNIMAFGLHIIFYVVIMNFILLTLTFYGSVRFVKVADFVFVFFAFFLPVKWFFEWKPKWA